MTTASSTRTCQAERRLSRGYTFACIRSDGHDGLHRDPLSNIEWSANMPTPTTPPIEETIRTTVAATLRDAHREGTPVECPHYTGAPGETEAPCEDCDAALVTAAILPLLAPDVRHKPPTGGPVKCLECKACTLPEGHNERCNCSCFTVPDDGPAHKTQAVQP